jgi:metal-responsive CopG/Arc/MetJ family transcriptional regulator
MANQMHKERITVTLEKDILDWIDRKVEDRTFANRSHGFEYLIQRKIDDESNRTVNKT